MAAVASCLAAVVTEIYSCGVCSGHELLRRQGRRGQVSAWMACALGPGAMRADAVAVIPSWAHSGLRPHIDEGRVGARWRYAVERCVWAHHTRL